MILLSFLFPRGVGKAELVLALTYDMCRHFKQVTSAWLVPALHKWVAAALMKREKESSPLNSDMLIIYCFEFLQHAYKHEHQQSQCCLWASIKLQEKNYSIIKWMNAIPIERRAIVSSNVSKCYISFGMINCTYYSSLLWVVGYLDQFVHRIFRIFMQFMAYNTKKNNPEMPLPFRHNRHNPIIFPHECRSHLLFLNFISKRGWKPPLEIDLINFCLHWFIHDQYFGFGLA